MSDIGLLVLRLVLGLYLSAHGAQKLFGWFHGYGLAGTSGWFDTMGFRPALFWTATSAAGELIGGLLVLFGFLNPLGSLAIAASMAVATLGVHWAKGPFALDGGFELPLTDWAIALALALTGPGRYSLDAALRTGLPLPLGLALGLSAAIVVLAALLGRRSRPAAVAAPAPESS